MATTMDPAFPRTKPKNRIETNPSVKIITLPPSVAGAVFPLKKEYCEKDVTNAIMTH